MSPTTDLAEHPPAEARPLPTLAPLAALLAACGGGGGGSDGGTPPPPPPPPPPSELPPPPTTSTSTLMALAGVKLNVPVFVKVWVT